MRRIALLGSVLVLTAALAACSSDDSSESGSQSQTKSKKNAPVVEGARVIPVEGVSFAFVPDAIRVGAGEDVTIELTSDQVFHDFRVDGVGHVVGADAGETARGGLRIDQPGDYVFYCTVLGHRQEGMQGTLVVEEPSGPPA